ncbi:type II toxin-antitoxin system ChpB family toxin [Halomonas sp. THAF12]|uniref:type II toxin-antitoxin system ChpB family toxin n=1 Tax=Halomonas sp. B23F22_10 TaxID=3459515 RepID=UPI00373F9A80
MKRTRFKRGDIVRVCLNPTEGHEQQGDFRPALVLTPAAFNQFGTAVIAPITQGSSFARHAGFAVTLTGNGTQTQGVVLVNQIRTVDLDARGARQVESAPSHIVDDALARVQTLFE